MTKKMMPDPPVGHSWKVSILDGKATVELWKDARAVKDRDWGGTTKAKRFASRSFYTEHITDLAYSITTEALAILRERAEALELQGKLGVPVQVGE